MHTDQSNKFRYLRNLTGNINVQAIHTYMFITGEALKFFFININ